jgi:chromate transporter
LEGCISPVWECIAWIGELFSGIKPAVSAIVLHAVHRICVPILIKPWLWGIAVVAFMVIFTLNNSFPIIVLLAAELGCFGSRFAPGYFSCETDHKNKSSGFLFSLDR